MRRLVPLLLATAVTSAVRTASAEVDAEDELAWAMIPGFRYGYSSFDHEDAKGASTSYSGSYGAVDLTVHAVLPGDRVAVGACGGLFFASGTTDGYTVDIDGFQVGPVIMIGIVPRFYLQGRAEWVSASDYDDNAVSGPRFGGGGSLVVYRGATGDVALQLDVMKFLGKTTYPDASGRIDALVVSGGLQFSFFSD